MSHIASNSVLGNKSLSISIFILTFLNISELLTSGAPTDFSTVLTTAQDLVQPPSSSWGFVGDIVSYGVEAVQNTIKLLIGVHEHPRQFYVVHIKDEKNPNNNRDVWRERGRENIGDIPVNGGKLPDNSLVVNGNNPVIEYAPSTGSSAPVSQANSPSTSTTPDKDRPSVSGSKPQNKNGPATKNTNPDDDEKNGIANAPRKESPSPAAGIQTIPEKAKSTKEEHSADHKLGPVTLQPENPKIAKPTNPTSEVPIEDIPQPTTSKLKTSLSNRQMSPAPSNVISQLKKDEPHAPNEVRNSDTSNGSFSASQPNNVALRNFKNQSPSVEKLISSLLEKESHSLESNNLSNLSNNHKTNTADEKIFPPQIPTPPIDPKPDHRRSFGDAESGLSKIQEPLLAQPPTTKPTSEVDDEFSPKQHNRTEPTANEVQNSTPFPSQKKETHPPVLSNEKDSDDHEHVTSKHANNSDESSEAPAFDPNDLISMNECKLEFERQLWETKPEFCEQFHSVEEFTAYVKENSGCSPNSSNQLPDSANDKGHGSGGLIAMNECETEYEKELCENYPDFCKEFESAEEFILFVKKNSECSPANTTNSADDVGKDSPGEEQDDAYHLDHNAAEDSSFIENHPHNLQSDDKFQDHRNGNDNDNETSSGSDFESTKPIETEKNGSKKKSKSTKEKKKQKN